MFDLSSLIAFDSKIALYHHETIESNESFTYRQIVCDSVKVKNCLDRIITDKTDVSEQIWRQFNIAIALTTHCPALLSAIIGIENSNGICCFIDSNNDWPTLLQHLAKLQTNICLCDEQFFKKCENCSDVVVVETINLANRNCFLLQLKSLHLKIKDIPIDNGNVNESSRILFNAMTSGTCDAARVIGVTYKSFWPNVVAFSHMYNVCSEDVIFISSPATFDPFMLDVAIALSHGATLLSVGQSVRLAPKQLLDLLFPSEEYSERHQLKCSIMQTTPSLFMRWTNREIAERVLSPASALRILALGGEAFPAISTLEQWQNWANSHRKRIFNLYGLTEMSCWASAYEVTNDDVKLKQSIPVGKPLDNFTRFELTSNGELWLKTNIRKCFQSVISDADVLNHGIEFTLHTGDVFDKRNDNEIIFKCRTNAVVKVYGRKVDLNYLETIAATVEHVRQACAVCESQRQIVIIFVVANIAGETEKIKNKIKNALQAKNVDVICEIVFIEQMPLSAHGKISKSKLLETFNSNRVVDETAESYSNVFLHFLNESLGFNVARVKIKSYENLPKRSKTAIESSFLALGGTSLKAMHILNELEERFRTQFPRLIPLMLNEATSIHEIVQELEKQEKLTNEANPSNDVIDDVATTACELWSIDMKKCIDATPSILRANETTIVSVGSHSKLLYNVRISDGVIISSIELPDRIESEVTQYDETQAMVGCYDGYLYCFDIATGKICWGFNSGGMVKCKVLLINDLAIFGNYNEDENLWCVNATHGTLCWSKRIGSKSIYSNPIRVNETDFIACTLDGFVVKLNAADGTLKWTIEIDVPIFTTPLLVNTPKKDFVISAAVNGSIDCWDCEKNHIWSHQIDGNIFTSFDCCTSSEQKTVVDVIFGSHNHHLYCLAFDTETELCSERWKCKTAAPIRATPRFLEYRKEKSILCCSTNGDVNTICCNNGTIYQRFIIDGNLFSTPAIDGNFVFIGSRNNLLYCYDLNGNYFPHTQPV